MLQTPKYSYNVQNYPTLEPGTYMEEECMNVYLTIPVFGHTAFRSFK